MLEQHEQNSRTPSRRVILAEVAGFCFGVRRAVDMTLAARQERFGKLTTLGRIIHNEQVIERLRGEGVDTARELNEIQEGTVVLSAHGVAPAVRQHARRAGLSIVDVACPFVTKVHRAAKQLVEQGYQLLLVGDPGHTEVNGIIGAVDGEVTVVSAPEDVASVAMGKKVGIVSQTTQSAETFARIVAEVARRVEDVRAINTICGATDELQDAARKLAGEVDVVIVIGGRSSANTRRLRDACEREGVPAYQVETADEIREEWLEGKDVIGVTAGASTPDWLIQDVIASLNGGEAPADLVVHHPDE